MAKTIHELIQTAREELSKATGLELSTTLGAVKDERGWRISIDMIEKHSIPDQMDILATYDVVMNNGEVLEFTRTGLRKRCDTQVGVQE